jgi:hypothetical protein
VNRTRAGDGYDIWLFYFACDLLIVFGFDSSFAFLGALTGFFFTVDFVETGVPFAGCDLDFFGSCCAVAAKANMRQKEIKRPSFFIAVRFDSVITRLVPKERFAVFRCFTVRYGSWDFLQLEVTN